jgi:hypothetical protein
MNQIGLLILFLKKSLVYSKTDEAVPIRYKIEYMNDIIQQLRGTCVVISPL